MVPRNSTCLKQLVARGVQVPSYFSLPNLRRQLAPELLRLSALEPISWLEDITCWPTPSSLLSQLSSLLTLGSLPLTQ